MIATLIPFLSSGDNRLNNLIFLIRELPPRMLFGNSVRSEIERKFRRQGGKGKITGGVVNATLRMFWSFQRGRRSLQAIAGEGYCRTASQQRPAAEATRYEYAMNIKRYSAM